VRKTVETKGGEKDEGGGEKKREKKEDKGIQRTLDELLRLAMRD